MSQKLYAQDIVPVVLFFQRQGLQGPVPNHFVIPKLPDQIILPYPISAEEQQREALFKRAQEDLSHDAEILSQLEKLDKHTTIPPGPKSPKR
jgi:hypothetical protein